MHRKVSHFVLAICLSASFCAQTLTATPSDRWEVAGDLAAVNAVGAKPVFMRPSELPQTTVSFAGTPEELPGVNPKELEKDQIPQMQLIPSFIPQHFAVQDGSVVESKQVGPQPLAPAKQKSFPGLSQTRFYPPDPAISVGPTHVIVCVNTAMAFYTRTGAKKFETSFATWFSKLPEDQNTSLFDPRVVYDQYSQHFIVLVAGIRTSDRRSWYFIAVSKTANPEGEWAQWALDMNLNGHAKTNNWADFPGIGLDGKGIYLTGNMFSFVTDNYVHAKIRVLDKAKVYQFGNITWADFFNLHDATGHLAFTVQPAHTYGISFDREFLVSSQDDQGTKITLWSIQNPVSLHPVLLKKGVTVSSYKFPPDAPEKGGGNEINTSDARFPTHTVASGGFIYAAHGVGFNWGTGEVAAIRIYQLTPAGTVVQEITYGADKLNYFYPALTVDSRGNVLLVFNRAGSNEFVGIHFTGRKVTDVAGKLQNSSLLKMSLSNYQSTDDSGRNRWGDYNTSALDPVDDSVWIYSEFATQADRWSTQIGKVKFN